ncbi:hypothetical protein R1sor_021397 [Riccia sorocarpa]|uniref:Uncharacterized protein n=1 Tax=Riccia sorocarpa TaxID=122646 RepID=A0ABD3GIE5_9MARC
MDRSPKIDAFAVMENVLGNSVGLRPTGSPTHSSVPVDRSHANSQSKDSATNTSNSGPWRSLSKIPTKGREQENEAAKKIPNARTNHPKAKNCPYPPVSGTRPRETREQNVNLKPQAPRPASIDELTGEKNLHTASTSAGGEMPKHDDRGFTKVSGKKGSTNNMQQSQERKPHSRNLFNVLTELETTEEHASTQGQMATDSPKSEGSGADLDDKVDTVVQDQGLGETSTKEDKVTDSQSADPQEEDTSEEMEPTTPRDSTAGHRESEGEVQESGDFRL